MKKFLACPEYWANVDGTRIRIVPPPRQLNPQMYYCRKGFPSINAQIICDATLTIRNVCAAFPGSSNDFFVWSGTVAKDVMVQAYFEDGCWLLGDSGYFLAPWLHVPIPHAAPGTPEFDYTQIHCSARNCVERCIGVLKARWRCLCSDRALTYRPTFSGQIINACCALHNYCLFRGLLNPRPYIQRVPVVLPDYNDLPRGLLARAAAEQRHLIYYAHARKQRLRQQQLLE
ncbi:putative nuclease HARBI1 [Frankliniella occidentalis]|uniref:Nuclease HARBI1 n=1 Tax=Frankliniella occidentalis TaxID=133901 RepID=A0A9C6U646_FRAOC|nr:putative nuclease HARBI1 [Frankliniella occidentalis]